VLLFCSVLIHKKFLVLLEDYHPKEEVSLRLDEELLFGLSTEHIADVSNVRDVCSITFFVKIFFGDTFKAVFENLLNIAFENFCS